MRHTATQNREDSLVLVVEPISGGEDSPKGVAHCEIFIGDIRTELEDRARPP